jgi:hypothetical protein
MATLTRVPFAFTMLSMFYPMFAGFFRPDHDPPQFTGAPIFIVKS